MATHGERLAVIESKLDGNGRDGICKMVEKHEKFFQRMKGAVWALVGTNLGVIISNFLVK